jgi:ligand-binding SRPBCC domain-containing protein
VPTFTSVQTFAFPLAAVFDALARPANLPRLAPPELRLEVVAAPERLALGAVVAVKARRWGLTRRVVTRVIEFTEGAAVVEEQTEGPFPAWRRKRLLEVDGAGTRVTEAVEYEPPGGMLGRVLTAVAVEAELTKAYAFREKALAELLGGAAGPLKG